MVSKDITLPALFLIHQEQKFCIVLEEVPADDPDLYLYVEDLESLDRQLVRGQIDPKDLSKALQASPHHCSWKDHYLLVSFALIGQDFLRSFDENLIASIAYIFRSYGFRAYLAIREEDLEDLERFWDLKNFQIFRFQTD